MERVLTKIRERPRLAMALWLASISLLAYAPFLLGGKTFIRLDHLTLIYPARQFLAEALQHWRLPWWCDALAFGSAFASNPQHLVFYPLAWLVAIFPLPWGIHLLIVLHVFWAGLGTALISERLGSSTRGAMFAGTVMMLSGYVGSMAEMGSPLMTLAWTPWALFFALQIIDAEDWTSRLRKSLWLSFIWALQILAGDPAGALTGSVLVFAVFVVRASFNWRAFNWRALLLIAAAGFFSLLLTSILLIPAVLMFRRSVRLFYIGHDDAMIWSLHPWRIVQWFLPRFFGDPLSTTGLEPTKYLAQFFANTAVNKELLPAWAYSEYVAAPVFLLAIGAARRSSLNRRLLFSSIFFVLIALGKYTPFYSIYRYVMFLELIVRYPERHIVGALILWSVLAGIGFRLFFEEKQEKFILRLAAGCAALLSLFWLFSELTSKEIGAKLLELLDENQRVQVNMDAAVSYALGGIGAAALLAIFVFGLVLLRQKGRALLAFWTPWMALLLIAGHLIIESRLLWLICDSAQVNQTADLTKYILAHHDRPYEQGIRTRVYRNPDNPTLNLKGFPQKSSELAEPFAGAFLETLGQNTAMRFGLAHVPGYEPGANASVVVTALLNAMPMSPQLFDIHWVIAQPQKVAAMKDFLRTGALGLGLYEVDNIHRRPRAFVTHSYKWLPDDQAIFKEMSAFGDLETIRLKGPGQDHVERAQLEPCLINSPYPERVELICEPQTAGYVMHLDMFTAGWEATIDGVPTPMIIADLLFRALPIEAGRHQIVFTYRLPGLTSGGWISAVAWLLWLWGMFNFQLAHRSVPRRSRSK